MENFIICPKCGTKNRAIKKVCYACLESIGFHPNPEKSARNLCIFQDVESGTMTYKEIGLKYNISLERVRQIYHAQHVKQLTRSIHT